LQYAGKHHLSAIWHSAGRSNLLANVQDERTEKPIQHLLQTGLFKPFEAYLLAVVFLFYSLYV
jgi:hypothetical protein